ncbi:MAG: hypothetical protein Q8L36_03695 [bacterium]|nr:hypothetical protein [bacterium]
MPTIIIETDPEKRQELILALNQEGLNAKEVSMIRLDLGDSDPVVIEVIAGKQTTAADVNPIISRTLKSRF